MAEKRTSRLAAEQAFAAYCALDDADQQALAALAVAITELAPETGTLEEAAKNSAGAQALPETVYFHAIKENTARLWKAITDAQTAALQAGMKANAAGDTACDKIQRNKRPVSGGDAPPGSVVSG